MEDQRPEELVSPLIEAARVQDLDKMSLSLHFAGQRAEGGVTALMICARQGFLDGVLLLANDEANLRDDRGCTALMYACQADCPGAVRLLADVEAGYVNKDGECALQIARRCGCSTEITDLLARVERVRPAYEEAVQEVVPANVKSVESTGNC